MRQSVLSVACHNDWYFRLGGIHIFDINIFHLSDSVKGIFVSRRCLFFFCAELYSICRYCIYCCGSVSVTKPNEYRAGYSVHLYIFYRNILYNRAVGRFDSYSADRTRIQIGHKKAAIRHRNVLYIKGGLRADFESVGTGYYLTIGNSYVFHNRIIAEPDGIFYTNTVIGSGNETVFNVNIARSGYIKTIGVGNMAVIVDNKILYAHAVTIFYSK